MSPTPRVAVGLVVCAVLALALDPVVGAVAALVLLGAAVADALAARPAPRVHRDVPQTLVRGRPVDLRVTVDSPSATPSGGAPGSGAVRVRQGTPPDLGLDRAEDAGGLSARLTARRRGRHLLPPVTVRRTGPLGLATTDHALLGPHELLVRPDLPAARRLALAVQQGRLRDPGHRPKGPLGLGTDFESVRDYVPGDDVRQVNWPATLRSGRPMANTYRVEQEREVVLLLDAGRLMAAPLGDPDGPAAAERPTRLDVAVDAAVAVALVADVLGDRCGVVAFDRSIRRRLPPRRAGGRRLVDAVSDLEPSAEDSDFGLALRTVAGGKRALVVILCDLVEETAVRPLVEAVPVLARRHAVLVASAVDDELVRRATAPPATHHGAYAAAVAVDVLAARRRAAAELERAGATVLEAPAASLGAACVRAYLRAKSRATL